MNQECILSLPCLNIFNGKVTDSAIDLQFLFYFMVLVATQHDQTKATKDIALVIT